MLQIGSNIPICSWIFLLSCYLPANGMWLTFLVASDLVLLYLKCFRCQ